MPPRKPKKPRSAVEVDAEAADRLFHRLEIGLAKAVLSVQPRHVGALLSLGTALTHLGRHKESLEADLRTVELLPDDATARYNLACSYSNLGRIPEALDALDKSIDLGYRDFPYLLQDPDLENVRQDPRFRALLDRKWGKRQPS